MSISCCVCDMDGTLLNSDRELSGANIAAIQALKAAGIKVILATGRSHLYVKDAMHKLGIAGPLISSNGGLISGAGQEVLYRKKIDPRACRRLADYCLDTGLDMQAYSDDYVYYSSETGRVGNYRRYNETVPADFRVPLRKLTTTQDLPCEEVVKFFLWNTDLAAHPELKTLLDDDGNFTVVSSTRGALDIMAPGISKGEALTYLSRAGVDLASTAAFGDNFNDLSMFDIVGMPIAVANAEDEVKRQARYITRSNDEDGIAYAVRKWILPAC